MSKSLVLTLALLVCAFPVVALADLSGTVTLQANTALNLDTGATAASGGDLLWSGSSLTPQGNAAAYDFSSGVLSGATQFANLTQAQLKNFTLAVSKSLIPSSTLVVGNIFVVYTNGGNLAKVLVTSNSGSSISLQYTTFGASSSGGGGGGTPTMTITEVENAATNIPAELPNSPIAQGSMFVVKGTLLGPATIAIATTFPLQTTIGGTSITVTVGGITVNAVMFYSLASQVAAILPSKTPTGAGTVKVTYNGQSVTAPIRVVQSNFGMYTLDSSGTGDAVAYLNTNSSLITPTNAANPGDVVIFWGTGLGPVASDETQPAAQADMPNVPLQVFVGGQPAKVLFHGRNACCSSADTIYVTVPSGVAGCAVSVIMQIGDIISNTTSIPIAASGRNCTPVNSTNPATNTGTGAHSYGGFALERLVNIGPNSTTKTDFVGGVFEKVTPPSSNPPQGSQIDINSYGSCTVSTAIGSQTVSGSVGTIQYLDAGTITITGPGISASKTLTKSSASGTVTYLGSLDNTATTFAPGTYTLTGAGGADVGPFTAGYNMPTPFVWTNQSGFSTVDRASGAFITWSGGDPAGYVAISGSSTAYGTAQTVTASFTCTARVSDGSFNVPPMVLLSLPASAAALGSTAVLPGTLTVTSVSPYTATFQAKGIDAGGVGSVFVYGSSAVYQ